MFSRSPTSTFFFENLLISLKQDVPLPFLELTSYNCFHVRYVPRHFLLQIISEPLKELLILVITTEIHF